MEKLKAKKLWLAMIVMIAAGSGVYVGLKKKSTHSVEHEFSEEESEEVTAESHSGHGGSALVEAIREIKGAFVSVQAKVEALHKSEVENDRLRLENANLRLQLESMRFASAAKEASHQTEVQGEKLVHDTGVSHGRIPASIKYQPPAKLLPEQLYALGVTYFQAKENEKAAVIFHHLLSVKESNPFATAQNYLMAGVSWYRVENFKLADEYFNQAMKTGASDQKIGAQARLWRALTAKRLGDGKGEQAWLKDLLASHPHATETAWVNSKKPVLRAPAAHEESAEETEHGEHHDEHQKEEGSHHESPHH